MHKKYLIFSLILTIVLICGCVGIPDIENNLLKSEDIKQYIDPQPPELYEITKDHYSLVFVPTLKIVKENWFVKGYAKSFNDVSDKENYIDNGYLVFDTVEHADLHYSSYLTMVYSAYTTSFTCDIGDRCTAVYDADDPEYALSFVKDRTVVSVNYKDKSLEFNDMSDYDVVISLGSKVYNNMISQEPMLKPIGGEI